MSKSKKQNTEAVAKSVDPDVLERLRDYKERNKLTQAALASELGRSESTVSLYLSGQPHGDVQLFEALVVDVINNAAKRKEINTQLFGTAMALKVHGACELARRLNDFHLVSGPAGIGKSCGAESYLFANATAILVNAAVWSTTWTAAFNLIWSSIETKWNGYTRRADYLINRFKGSNRLIIVDNAHRLGPSGFKFLFDFHDATRCPLVLIGNPEIIRNLENNDQHFSRTGRHTKITVKDIEDPQGYARTMIQHFAPRFSDCEDLAVKLILKPGYGHLRALRKILLDSEEMAGSASYREKATRDIFLLSSKQQVRDYDL